MSSNVATEGVIKTEVVYTKTDTVNIESEEEEPQNLQVYNTLIETPGKLDIKFSDTNSIIYREPKSFLKICELAEIPQPAAYVTFTLYVVEKTKVDSDRLIAPLNNENKLLKTLISSRSEFKEDGNKGDQNEEINNDDLKNNNKNEDVEIKINKKEKEEIKNNPNKIKDFDFMAINPHLSKEYKTYLEDMPEQPENKIEITNINEKTKGPKPSVSYSKNPVKIPLSVKKSIEREIYQEGNLIGYNHSLFKNMWIINYITLLISAGLILTGELLFLNKVRTFYSIIELLDYLLIIILCITAVSAIRKMRRNDKVEFSLENIGLYFIIFLSFFNIIGIYNSSIGGIAYVFLNSHFVLFTIFFIILILISISLIILNNMMIDFYNRYREKEAIGTLLQDIKE